MRADAPALHRRSLLAAAAAAITAPSGASGQRAAHQGMTTMRIRLAFGTHAFTAALLDNPTARDLVAMLPLDLKITDYSTNEKIAYLPRKLTEESSGAFGDEATGDVCYYAPWGNLAFFHGAYRYSPGLIRLGRLDGGIAPLLTRGEFPLRIELVT